MFSQNHRIIYFKQVGRNSRNNHWFAFHIWPIQLKIPLLIVLDGDYLFDPFMAPWLWMLLGWFTWNHCYCINQRNNRMEDCRYNKDNGLPSEKELLFLNLLAENYCPTLKKKKYRTV
jgi:hypothetical protein